MKLLDHYVPQAHLKKWLLPGVEHLFAIRKSDLVTFKPSPKNICAVRDGNTNKFLQPARKIEEFLEKNEPRYSQAVDALSSGDEDRESILVLAGFVACIMLTAPAGNRMHRPFLKKILESTALSLSNNGSLPRLRGQSAADLIRSDALSINVNGLYPQAVAIEQLDKLVIGLTHGEWELIRNELPESPFFTSDYPVGIAVSKQFPRINDKLVPLTPELALRIKPNLDTERTDAAFTKFKFRSRRASFEEVTDINRAIVRCAENTIVYKADLPWIERFVAQNKDYWVEEKVTVRRSKRSATHFSRQVIAKRPSDAASEQLPEGEHWFDISAKRVE